MDSIVASAPMIEALAAGGGSSYLLDDVTGAAIAHSFRKLRSAYSGDCCKVRRISDDATQDIGFSGNFLDTSALTDFLTDIYESDFSGGSHDWESHSGSFTFTGNVDSIGGEDDWLQVDVSSGSQIRNDAAVANSGTNGAVTLKVYVPSSTSVTGIKVFTGTLFSGPTSGTFSTDAVSTLTFAVNGNTSFPRIYVEFTGAAGGDTVYIKEVKLDGSGQDGHLHTWYDQSGNGRDTTQSASATQPKIYDGSSWIYPDFNGSNMPRSGTISGLDDDHTVFVAIRTGSSLSGYKGIASEGGGLNMFAALNGGAWGTYHLGDKTADTTLSTGTDYLLGMLRSGGGTGDFRLNGGGDGTYSDTSRHTEGYLGGIGSQYMAGTIYEYIVWDADKTSDLTTIEGSINDQYFIY